MNKQFLYAKIFEVILCFALFLIISTCFIFSCIMFAVVASIGNYFIDWIFG